MKKISHFIDGKIYSDGKSRMSPIFNPAIGEKIAEVELASKATVEMAIKSSEKAFQKWSKTTPINRARILAKFKDLLIQNMNDLAEMVSEQHGKTIADAKGSIQRGIEVVEYATGITDSLKGDHSANVGTNVDSHTLRQPLGVCAGITPFNFPAKNLAIFIKPSPASPAFKKHPNITKIETIVTETLVNEPQSPVSAMVKLPKKLLTGIPG